MQFSDFMSVIQWWFVLFGIGIIFLPLTTKLFEKFFDKGYIFAKVLGIGLISYLVFVVAIIKIFSFSSVTIFIFLIGFAVIAIFLLRTNDSIRNSIKSKWKIFLFEEIIFFLSLLFWSYIRSFQPNINGLEKFMDFGFVNAILRGEYFPPHDMWFTPFSINYYYFGHLITAVLTKLSGIPSFITYNLMMATLFAFTFTGAFSIGFNLIQLLKPQTIKISMASGFLAAFLTAFAGNLHTIYSFFASYNTENPAPFWQMIFSPQTFPNGYWYPNATRFIYNTIHEYPQYSFVVSDLHGHVLDIPFVLLTISLLLSIFIAKQITTSKLVLLSFLLAIMYMTNAWDGVIYFLLTALVVFYFQWQKIKRWSIDLFIGLFVYLFIIGIGFALFSLPFSLNFKPFVSGIGVLCAPEFLTNIGKIGPLLFEKDHCQHSPLYQLGVLHGFFYFCVISFLIFLGRKKLILTDGYALLLTTLSTILIIIPEFFYAKDIYPAHYRANTMFKLAYQSFVMLSIVSSYVIIRIISNIKSKILLTTYYLLLIPLFSLVAIYPYFAINSYYEQLKTYRGLDGIKYIKDSYPTDYQAILWLNKNIQGKPVILEAQGDSYTDYARVSANTGLPTVLGWTVHEWLWRGTYDIPAPRITDVQTLYESDNLEKTKELIKKYNIELVFLGDLERQKYTNIQEEKFAEFGDIVFQNGTTKIYKVH